MAKTKPVAMRLTSTCSRCKSKIISEVAPGQDDFIAPDLCNSCVGLPPEPKQNGFANARPPEQRAPGCSLCRAEFDLDEIARRADTCGRCEDRIAHCIACGDKTSEFLCLRCIRAGARPCEMCTRPAPRNGSFCQRCDKSYAAKNAGQFDPNDAPLNTRENFTPGGEGNIVIASPGARFEGNRQDIYRG